MWTENVCLMSVTIWRLVDGTRGHDNQSLGLSRAIARLCGARCYDIPAHRMRVRDFLRGRFPAGKRLPDPHLILGAGHATHPCLLAARRARGGRAVVLMKPSLPMRCFDLCLVPQHDNVSECHQMVATQGVLNTIEASSKVRADRGLILIGGSSAHSRWEEKQIVEQLNGLIEQAPNMKWRVTDSRRTPKETSKLLASLSGSNVEFHACEDTGPDWVSQELKLASHAWVTEDSVSMVYEALSSGAAVGLLQVPLIKPGRIARGIRQLVETGKVTSYRDWQKGQKLAVPDPVINEATRCAALICDRFLH